MALTESVILDIQSAQRQINTLETQLDALSQPIDVSVEIDTPAVERAASEVNRIADNAGNAEDAFRRVAASLGISEDAARDLASATGTSTQQATRLDDDLRQVARSMGLSEQEAAKFARQMQTAGSATGETSVQARELESNFSGVVRQVAGIAAALFGIHQVTSAVRSVLSAGFERFTTIENSARAMSIQLGSAAEGAALLAGVLDVVRGTPFNLDQFAQAATQLVAFGVEARQIPGFLTAIGEAAATRGAQAGEFVDRLVTVFGQITTQGRITGEHINRLGEAGVNALAILANSFGVTTEEMRKMVSQGVIPAEEALQFLATGIIEGTEGIAGSTVALGGTMEGLRETLTGAVGGFNAAIARLGAAFIEGIAPQLTEGINEVSGAIDAQLIPAIAGFSAALGEIDTSGFITFLAGVPTAASTLATQVSSAAQAFGNAFQVFGAIAMLDFGDVGDQFRQLGEDIEDFRGAGAANEAVQNLIQTLAGGVEPVAALESVLKALGENVSSLTLDQFEPLALQLVAMASAAGATSPELADLARVILQFGEDAGFSAAGIEILAAALTGPLASAQAEASAGDIIAANMAAMGDAAGEAAGPVIQLGDALESVADTTVSDALALIEDEFSKLPGAVESARTALQTEEDETVEDAAGFISDLQDELSKLEDFTTDINIARALGLDDTVALAAELGPEFANVLSQAIDDPATAALLESTIEGFAEAEAAFTNQALTTALLDEFSEAIQIPLDIDFQLRNIRFPGAGNLFENLALGPGGTPPPPTPQGPNQGGGVTVNQVFTGPVPPTPDLVRANQAVNQITQS